MQTVICPECGGNTPIQPNAMVGEIIQCPECGAELEVRGVDPPEVELAPEMQEDWGE